MKVKLQIINITDIIPHIGTFISKEPPSIGFYYKLKNHDSDGVLRTLKLFSFPDLEYQDAYELAKKLREEFKFKNRIITLDMDPNDIPEVTEHIRIKYEQRTSGNYRKYLDRRLNRKSTNNLRKYLIGSKLAIKFHGTDKELIEKSVFNIVKEKLCSIG